MWRYLKELLEAPPNHFIHDEGSTPERLRPYATSQADPIFGHCMERLWNPLFRCLDKGVPCCFDGSPSCAPGDCQCLDEPAGGNASASG